MKIAIISDIHGNLKKLKELNEFLKRKEINLLLIAGDLTDLGEREEARKVIERIGLKKILAIPGNMDGKTVLDFLEEKKISLHNKKIKLGGIEFIGFGGSNGEIGKTNFSEQEIMNSLEKLFKGSERAVLLTHVPPKNTEIDLSYSERHIGSESVKKIIQKFQPLIHFCGHVHERKGEILIGKTKSINIGPFKEGNVVVFDLRKGKTERIELK